MDTFSALADPTRRNILEMLAASGALSAGDIGKQFDSSAPAISQHLKVLREAELVEMEKKAQLRIYRINPKALDEVEAWIDRMRSYWNQRLDVLEHLLKSEDEAAQPSSHQPSKKE